MFIRKLKSQEENKQQLLTIKLVCRHFENIFVHCVYVHDICIMEKTNRKSSFLFSQPTSYILRKNHKFP